MKTRRVAFLLVAACLLLGLARAVYAVGGTGNPPPPEPPGPQSQDCSAGTNWAPYGWSNPGDSDPKYGLGYPDPYAQDLVGFAAKGNIVVGDYTHSDFQSDVLPLIDGSHNHAYAVDPTDGALGYSNTGSALCDGAANCFNGNYTQDDGGAKTDGSPRKFYESSLTEAQLKDNYTLVNPYISKTNSGQYSDTFDGIYFTNHGFIGKVGSKWINFNGSIVARDDAFVVNGNLDMTHDVRLMDSRSSNAFLPLNIGRPRLLHWQECPASGCTN